MSSDDTDVVLIWYVHLLKSVQDSCKIVITIKLLEQSVVLSINKFQHLFRNLCRCRCFQFLSEHVMSELEVCIKKSENLVGHIVSQIKAFQK